MSRRFASRADGTEGLSRRGLLAAGSAATVATAGCIGILGDDEADADGPLVANAPTDAATLARVEPADLSDEERTRLLEELGAVESERLDVEAIVDGFADRTGLDTLEADAFLAFAPPEEIPTDALLESDWSEDEAVASLEDATGVAYESVEYRDEPALYEPTDPDGASEPAFLGVHDEGRYVVGDEEPVRASLETRYGDDDAASGPGRDAYDEAREAYGAPVTLALEPSGPLLPEAYRALAPSGATDALESVSSLGGGVDVRESGVDLSIALHVDDGDPAELEDVVRGLVALLAETDDEHGDDLEAATVERDGERVELFYEGDPEPVVALLDEV